jgi:hypothetical protein
MHPCLRELKPKAVKFPLQAVLILRRGKGCKGETMKFITLISVGLVFLNACSTPLQPIKDFGAASRSVGTTASAAYKQFDGEVAEAKYRSAMLRGQSINPDTFSGILTKNKRLASREAMLNELVNYSAALEALASKDASADIKDAATKLDTNLNALGKDYNSLAGGGWPLTKGDTAALATVVRVIGDAWVLHVREEAIRKVVLKSDPAIQKASALLKREFESIGPTVGGIYEQAQIAYMAAYEKKKGAMDPAATVTYGNMIKKVHDRVTEAPAFYEKVANSCATVGTAHAKLRVTVQANQFLSKDFIDSVQQLTAYAQDTKKFYEGLNK